MLMVYDVNSYVKSQLSPEFEDIDIMPLTGIPETSPPFILYNWTPAKVDIERFYQRKDIVIYNLYDTDIDRMYHLTDELISILNKADLIQGSIPSSDNRALYIDWRGGTSMPTTERDGFHRMIFEFWICYVPLMPRLTASSGQVAPNSVINNIKL